MFCGIFSNGRHPGMPNCKKKKSNWLHAKIMMTQSSYIPLRFSLSHILLLLVTKTILTGLLIFNFETAQCKNHFNKNLVRIQSTLIEILSFSGLC